MEKVVVAAVLMMLVVLMMLDVAPVAADDKPLIMPKIRLEPAFNSSTKDGILVGDDTHCPGGGACDADATCCLSINGHYQCCPRPAGNCCFDYRSCCPSGYVCNSSHQTCIRAGLSEDVLDKLPFLKK